MNNVELFRECMRVWNEEGLSGLMSRYDDFCTDDFEWHPPISEVTGARYVGREGSEQYVADMKETLGDFRVELQDVTEVAPDVVRFRTRVHGEGTSSGAVIDATSMGVTRFRDGRMWWSWSTYDPAAAERVAEQIARGEEVHI